MPRLCKIVTIFIFFNFPIFAICQETFTDPDNNNATSIGELVGVAVIYRHGDRTPVQPYPNDPYKNESLWPVDFGQLTNVGKRRHFYLGQWLRKRYDGFLPLEYSERDIYVRSTDVDRTLMSAESNLAGLYPPRGKQVWDKDLAWQPVPIHTIPEKEDYVLAAKKRCQKYDKLLKALLKSPEFVEINRKNHDLYAYLTRYSGTLVNSLDTLEYLYNTLYIETIFNFTLPNWTNPVFPDKMKPWAELSFAVPSYNEKLARLKTGPLITEIVGRFQERISYLNKSEQNVSNTENATRSRFEQLAVKGQKFWMYSAHDITIANVLQSLGLFQYHCPPYTSTVIFELRSYRAEHYVNIFYKNSTVPQAFTLKGCDFNCPLDSFLNIVEPLLISAKEWEKECKTDVFGLAPMPVVALGGFILAVLLLIIFLKMLCSSIINKRNSKKYSYLRLPNEDA